MKISINIDGEDSDFLYVENILGDTAASFNSSNAQTFRPQAGMDVANGTLPPGEVDLSQIAGLMNK